MLTELESRLADVLGQRLPAPFGGRVRRRGQGAPVGVGPVVRLGVIGVQPLRAEFTTVRPEVVPGSGDQRRVVRLRVQITIDVETEPPGDRTDEVAGLDALIYDLDDPGMRSGVVLVQPGDQGFLLDSLHLADSDEVEDAGLVLEVEGWFWPVGQAGQAGQPIERALVREFRLPVLLNVGGPLAAGGGAVDLSVAFNATGTMDLRDGSVGVTPFGSIALRLRDGGGGPGAGTLAGGEAGPEDTRVVAVDGGPITVSYTPPGSPAVDHLVVLAHTTDVGGDQRLGMELARFDLAVTP